MYNLKAKLFKLLELGADFLVTVNQRALEHSRIHFLQDTSAGCLPALMLKDRHFNQTASHENAVTQTKMCS